MMADRVIKARHLAPYVCGSGMKNFCKATGLSYIALVRDGYPEALLRSFGDVNCNEVIDQYLASPGAAQDGQQ